MKESLRNEILAAYYGSLAQYEKVGIEIRRFFDAALDPSVPADAIYTIKQRLKAQDRFLERVEERADSDLTVEYYSELVNDVLGIRIVCLRLSDVEKIEEFVAALRAEDKIRFVEGPVRKKTFVLRVDPREEADEELDFQYSGYSSTHYLITLGEASGLPEPLTEL